MRIFIFLVGVVALIGPILFWIYLVSLGCAFSTNNANCGLSAKAFFDWEFLEISALPWAMSLGCFFAVYRMTKKKHD